MVADDNHEVPVIDCAYSMKAVMADGSLGRERDIRFDRDDNVHRILWL